jgi:DNA-binding protein H-NS
MNLETLSIEDLAALRDRVITALSDKVAARQKELLAESERVGALVTSKPSTARPKRPVKYRDGENSWTGVGTMPAWAKLKGDTLESYRVT